MSGRSIDLGDVVLRQGAAKSSSLKANAESRNITSDPEMSNTQEQTGRDSVESPVPFDTGKEEIVEKVSVSPRRNRGEGIRTLRGVRKTSSATLFNVSLDEPTKNRLEQASFENKVKQTVIVRAAIDEFLKKNGY